MEIEKIVIKKQTRFINWDLKIWSQNKLDKYPANSDCIIPDNKRKLKELISKNFKKSKRKNKYGPCWKEKSTYIFWFIDGFKDNW